MIQARALERDVIMRATPEAVYLCPPLIIARTEVDALIDELSACLDDAYVKAQPRGLITQTREAAE